MLNSNTPKLKDFYSVLLVRIKRDPPVSHSHPHLRPDTRCCVSRRATGVTISNPISPAWNTVILFSFTPCFPAFYLKSLFAPRTISSLEPCLFWRQKRKTRSVWSSLVPVPYFVEVFVRFANGAAKPWRIHRGLDAQAPSCLNSSHNEGDVRKNDRQVVCGI